MSIVTLNNNLTMTESQKNLINSLIYEIKNINFKTSEIKNNFIEDSVEYTFKKFWGVFDKVSWKDIIKYSICSTDCKYYKLGKLFKQSPNGIYDFIVSGYSFGPINNSDNYYGSTGSEHGIMILNVHDIDIYCYYKIDMGGCPTCGYDIVYSEPEYVELYMSFTIDGLVEYCISEFHRNQIKLFLSS